MNDARWDAIGWAFLALAVTYVGLHLVWSLLK